MDTDRPDSSKPTAKVVPMRRKRVVHMDTLGKPDAQPIPPGFRAKSMEFRRRGKLLERVEFDADGKPRKG